VDGEVGQASDADVSAAQAGDEAAFARLFRATQPGLLRYVAVLAGRDSEDVCAEAWAQACRDLSKFAGDLDAFRGWVARIARNRAVDLHRSRRRRPVELVPVEDLYGLLSEVSGEHGALEVLSTAHAVAAIMSLPSDQAEAVMLRAVMGLDAVTAGKVLGKRAGAVRTAAYRGLKTLASRYEPSDRERMSDITTARVANRHSDILDASSADELI
jgi:RNA polymerase sigma-70 factor (ECF subfamily)